MLPQKGRNVYINGLPCGFSLQNLNYLTVCGKHVVGNGDFLSKITLLKIEESTINTPERPRSL